MGKLAKQRGDALFRLQKHGNASVSHPRLGVAISEEAVAKLFCWGRILGCSLQRY
jgi:hypothetical protein